MTFAEKLKHSRKAAGMTQEALAEKLGVSRQAVTKWETDRGIPDIENIMRISNLFGMTVDEFLVQEKETARDKEYLFESRTEYDIDGVKRFDMKLGGAALLRVVGTSGEKVLLHLASNDIPALESDFKVKIDDIRNRIDIDVNRKNNMTETKAKESLVIEVFIPNQYLEDVEVEIHCRELHFSDIVCEHMEYKGKADKVFIDSVKTTLELDCNQDMDIRLDSFAGSLEINQIASTSRLTVPADFSFQTIKKGIANSVIYENNGETAEDFSELAADSVIELNGLKSELVIARGEALN